MGIPHQLIWLPNKSFVYLGKLISKTIKIMKKRQLTGNWYLKRTIWGTYRVMVEVEINSHDGSGWDFTLYKKATEIDIVELGIYCNKY